MKWSMYLSWNGILHTRPVDFVHGVEIIALGVALFMVLELEKLALRKWCRKHDGSRGSAGRSEAKS